jgi:hypothetical protein
MEAAAAEVHAVYALLEDCGLAVAPEDRWGLESPLRVWVLLLGVGTVASVVHPRPVQS